jgi:hypothetical protein
MERKRPLLKTETQTVVVLTPEVSRGMEATARASIAISGTTLATAKAAATMRLNKSSPFNHWTNSLTG